MVTVYASIPDTNGDINVFYTDDDERAPDLHWNIDANGNVNEHAAADCDKHPDCHFDPAPANCNSDTYSGKRPLHEPRP